MEENKYFEMLNDDSSPTQSIDEANEVMKQAQETLEASKQAIEKAEAESEIRFMDVDDDVLGDKQKDGIAVVDEVIDFDKLEAMVQESSETKENSVQEEDEIKFMDDEQPSELPQEDNGIGFIDEEQPKQATDEVIDFVELEDSNQETSNIEEDKPQEEVQFIKEESNNGSNNNNNDSQKVNEEKPKDKSFSKLLIIVIVVGILLGVGGYFGYKYFSNKPQQDPVEPTIDVVDDTPKEKQPERDLWLENKAINEDYIGEVVFESGLVDKSFVQAEDVYDKNGDLYHFYTEYGSLVTDPTGYTGNDVYIWTNWKDMTYDYNILGGSVFMDYRNTLDDQNIIIYGHHFSVGGGNDPERIKAFTPLELLLKEENFKGNEKVKLILDNETRTYQIAGIYIFDMTNADHLDNGQYWRTNYNYEEYSGEVQNDFYDNYIEFVEENKLYDTGIELTTQDNTLTLQTCIGGSTTEFEILVLKELEVKKYSD